MKPEAKHFLVPREFAICADSGKERDVQLRAEQGGETPFAFLINQDHAPPSLLCAG